jgi:hypothetical protein
MTVHAPFEGNRGGNQVVEPGAASATVTLTGDNKSVRLVNSGANICHVRVGVAPQVATTADLPVLSGESIVLQKEGRDLAVAHISALGTTLHVQPGEGGY